MLPSILTDIEAEQNRLLKQMHKKKPLHFHTPKKTKNFCIANVPRCKMPEPNGHHPYSLYGKEQTGHCVYCFEQH